MALHVALRYDSLAHVFQLSLPDVGGDDLHFLLWLEYRKFSGSGRNVVHQLRELGFRRGTVSSSRVRLQCGTLRLRWLTSCTPTLYVECDLVRVLVRATLCRSSIILGKSTICTVQVQKGTIVNDMQNAICFRR